MKLSGKLWKFSPDYFNDKDLEVLKYVISVMQDE